MKFCEIPVAASLALLASASAIPSEIEARAEVQGFDISNYQPTVDFAGAYNSGARFVIIKVRSCRVLLSVYSN
jgi:GH25 family lysozyme M1 (1,4-beta-N-acetylmuramidase)